MATSELIWLSTSLLSSPKLVAATWAASAITALTPGLASSHPAPQPACCTSFFTSTRKISSSRCRGGAGR
jgi:hypothetical protein